MDSFAITEGLAAQEQHDAPPEMSAKLSEETNKFQRAIAAWRGEWPKQSSRSHLVTCD